MTLIALTPVPLRPPVGIGELRHARDRFARMVDDRVGIISRVDLVRPAPGAPEVFVAHAEPSDTTPLVGLAAANRGAAASVERDRAVVRACGESVERYCSGFPPTDAMRLAGAEQLRAEGAHVVETSELYPFGQDQYADPHFPYEPVAGRPQRWVRAGRAGDSGTAWVPASCVYVPYLFDRRIEPFTHMPISTGLAAGPDLASCVHKGICEILERDALMVRWHNRWPAVGIDVESVRGQDELIDRSLACGAIGWSRWRLSLLTLDVEVPILLAALVDDDAPGGLPMTSVGVSADPEPLRALLLAVEEALLTRVLLARSSDLVGGPAPQPTTLRGHMLAHARSPRLRRELRFLTDPPEQIGFDHVADRFARRADSLPDRLTDAGSQAWWVDVTTPDVAAVDLRVARTVIPGFQPLDNDHRRRHLGGGRLDTVPARLGRAPVRPRNPYPHPFP